MSEELLLAFADDEHMMGQQHTEWIGVAPFLEEDLAFSSIAQDELGHAALLYERVLAARGVEATDAAIDELAYRDGGGYRSCALTEYRTDDWAEALVRHWIYDTVEEMRWAHFANSSDVALRELAVVAERDEVFHRRHANALIDRLFTSPEARTRVLGALDVMVPMVPGLLAPTADTGDAIASGVVSGSIADIADDVAAAIAERFDVDAPTLSTAADGRTQRSDHFEPLMTRMREVLDLDPAATW